VGSRYRSTNTTPEPAAIRTVPPAGPRRACSAPTGPTPVIRLRNLTERSPPELNRPTGAVHRSQRPAARRCVPWLIFKRRARRCGSVLSATAGEVEAGGTMSEDLTPGSEPGAQHLPPSTQVRPGLGMSRPLFGLVLLVALAAAAGVGLVVHWNLVPITLTMILSAAGGHGDRPAVAT
jgi:hypothetical protein